MGELREVVVVGAGTMGSQIALQAALSGRYPVTVVDASAEQLERALAQNQKLVARGVEKGRHSEEQGRAALAAISSSRDLAAAAKGADLVIEAVFEDFEVKKAIFQEA